MILIHSRYLKIITLHKFIIIMSYVLDLFSQLHPIASALPVVSITGRLHCRIFCVGQAMLSKVL